MNPADRAMAQEDGPEDSMPLPAFPICRFNYSIENSHEFVYYANACLESVRFKYNL